MKNDMKGEVNDVSTSLLIPFFIVFNCCLSIVLWPEEVYRVVHVIINKHSFESSMCLGLILER